MAASGWPAWGIGTACSRATSARCPSRSPRPTPAPRPPHRRWSSGRWLAGRPRDECAIATKVRFPMGKGPNEVGLSRKHILASVEASLRRLRTDYIDLYQVHSWDGMTPLGDTLSTMHTLVQGGKVRYLGASNFSGWQLQKAVDTSRQMGWEPFVCLQPQYNLLTRTPEWEILPVCQNEGLGVIPWSPLRGGWLSGKFRRGMEGPPADSRVAVAEQRGWGERWSTYNNERTWSVLDALFAVAEEAAKTPAQVAINWLLRRPTVTAPIIGARSMEQLDANLGASGWALTPDPVECLNRASHPGLPHPYDHLAGAQARR